MSLKNLRSDLRNIKWGANKPLVTTPIPSYEDPLSNKFKYGTGGPDLVARSGTLLPLRIIRDTERITKLFTTTPGVIFTAKQFILNSTSAKGPNDLTRSGNLTNPYLPTSTIAQTVGVSAGLHLNKQGINPFSGLGNGKGYSPNRYFDNAKNSQELIQLYNRNITGSSLFGNNILYSYTGGPNSFMGLGLTLIKRTTKTGIEGSDGLNIKRLISNNTYNSVYKSGFYLPDSRDINFKTSPSKLSLSEFWNSLELDKIEIPSLDNRSSSIVYNSVYEQGTLEPRKDLNELGQQPEKSPVSYLSNIQKGYLNKNNDKSTFGKERPNTIQKKGGSLGPLTPNVPDSKRYPQRIYIEDPGLSNGSFTDPLDKITADTEGIYKDDLVKFRITSINNQTLNKFGLLPDPKLKGKDIVYNSGNDGECIQFRAFLDNFSDSYNASWNSFRYAGRGENFYKYDGFTRSIPISWTIFAQSYPELIPMYQKMNWLASNLMPDYNLETGYMMGPMVKMTVGGYIYETPGFITNLTYDITNESPWEIGLNIENGTYSYDERVKELPHMIKASMTFTPIHDFLPRKILGKVKDANNKETRFISLDTGGGSNYPK